MIPKGVQDTVMGLPSSWATVILIIVFGSLFVLFVAFNKQILKFLGKCKLSFNDFVVKTFGSKFRHADKKLKRKANLKNRSLIHKVYRVFNNIIINLNLQKSGVTVSGLLLFMIISSVALAIVVGLVFNFEIVLMVANYGHGRRIVHSLSHVFRFGSRRRLSVKLFARLRTLARARRRASV